MEQLRQSIMSEADGYNTKRRFGLFSQPTTIALGDNSVYPSKTGTSRPSQPAKERTENQSLSPATCWEDPIDPE